MIIIIIIIITEGPKFLKLLLYSIMNLDTNILN
jgi:hypothetical protein